MAPILFLLRADSQAATLTFLPELLRQVRRHRLFFPVFILDKPSIFTRKMMLINSYPTLPL